MLHLLIATAILFAPPEVRELKHDANTVYHFVTTDGIKVDGQQIKPDPPTFGDEMSQDEQLAALRRIAGSERGATEMMSDSISAPHKLTIRDTKTKTHVVRSGDLYFCVRVDLNTIQPQKAFAAVQDRAVEAGNMRFEAKAVAAGELQVIGEKPREDLWYVRAKLRLLDRIVATRTDQVASSRSEDSVIVAARTDERFNTGASKNEWQTLTVKGSTETLGTPRPYAGGAGYAKMTRLKGEAGRVIVETHFVYAEPLEWFDGAPILRSKFGLIAQDQIRRLRSELKKATTKSEAKSGS